MISKPSYQQAVGTTLLTGNSGKLTFCSVIAGTADATVTLYDVNATADIATTNALVSFKVDLDLNGFQGGGNIAHPLRYSRGLCVVVAGTGATAYLGYTKG